LVHLYSSLTRSVLTCICGSYRLHRCAVYVLRFFAHYTLRSHRFPYRTCTVTVLPVTFTTFWLPPRLRLLLRSAAALPRYAVYAFLVPLPRLVLVAGYVTFTHRLPLPLRLRTATHGYRYTVRCTTTLVGLQFCRSYAVLVCLRLLPRLPPYTVWFTHHTTLRFACWFFTLVYVITALPRAVKVADFTLVTVHTCRCGSRLGYTRYRLVTFFVRLLHHALTPRSLPRLLVGLRLPLGCYTRGFWLRSRFTYTRVYTVCGLRFAVYTVAVYAHAVYRTGSALPRLCTFCCGCYGYLPVGLWLPHIYTVIRFCLITIFWITVRLVGYTSWLHLLHCTRSAVTTLPQFDTAVPCHLHTLVGRRYVCGYVAICRLHTVAWLPFGSVSRFFATFFTVAVGYTLRSAAGSTRLVTLRFTARLPRSPYGSRIATAWFPFTCRLRGWLVIVRSHTPATAPDYGYGSACGYLPAAHLPVPPLYCLPVAWLGYAPHLYAVRGFCRYSCAAACTPHYHTAHGWLPAVHGYAVTRWIFGYCAFPTAAQLDSAVLPFCTHPCCIRLLRLRGSAARLPVCHAHTTACVYGSGYAHGYGSGWFTRLHHHTGLLLHAAFCARLGSVCLHATGLRTRFAAVHTVHVGYRRAYTFYAVTRLVGYIHTTAHTLPLPHSCLHHVYTLPVRFTVGCRGSTVGLLYRYLGSLFFPYVWIATTQFYCRLLVPDSTAFAVLQLPLFAPCHLHHIYAPHSTIYPAPHWFWLRGSPAILHTFGYTFADYCTLRYTVPVAGLPCPATAHRFAYRRFCSAHALLRSLLFLVITRLHGYRFTAVTVPAVPGSGYAV